LDLRSAVVPGPRHHQGGQLLDHGEVLLEGVCVCSLALMPGPSAPLFPPPSTFQPLFRHIPVVLGGGGGYQAPHRRGAFSTLSPHAGYPWVLCALCVSRKCGCGLLSAGQVDNSADRRFASGKTQALIDAEERQHRLRTGMCAARAAPRPCDRCSLFRQRAAVARLRPYPWHHPCRRGCFLVRWPSHACMPARVPCKRAAVVE
jgi:hypothetical protein